MFLACNLKIIIIIDCHYMLPHCWNIMTPESVSTMQYHCLSLAEMEEGECDDLRICKRFPGKLGISVSIGLFLL